MGCNTTDVLEKYFRVLRSRPGVLNVVQGTKIVNGKPVPAVIVYVEQKKPLDQLTVSEVIPPKLDDCIPTDVVELKPVGWVAGHTNVSYRPPRVQRRLANGVKK